MTSTGYNVELFRKIHEQITRKPDTHDQDSWEINWAETEGLRLEDKPVCGTTRCVAGWAIHFAMLEVDETEGYEHKSHSIHDRFRYGVTFLGSTEAVARKLLGLSEPESRSLFLHTSNETAATIVEEIAETGQSPTLDLWVE